MKDILVVGADSQLAASYLTELCRIGVGRVDTTSRRPGATFVFDLTKPVPTTLRKRHYHVGIVFAGMTDMAACDTNPSLANDINNEAVIRLMQDVSANNWIILSTNMVFDGKTANVPRDYPLTPFNTYGESKAHMEKNASELAAAEGFELAIVRMTKVLEPNRNRIQDFVDRMAEGLAVHAYTDMSFCPVHVRDVTDFLTRLTSDFNTGIFQLSGNRDISYAEALALVAKKFGLDRSLIKSESSVKPTPQYTSLLVDTLEQKYGFKMRDSYSTLAAAIHRPSKGPLQTSRGDCNA